MKIIGGHFGVAGSAYITRHSNQLVVEGTPPGQYSRSEVADVMASTTNQSQFGVVGCLVGFAILGAVLGSLFGALGVLVALVVAVAGSFYPNKVHTVNLVFTDNRTVNLECTPRGVKKLLAFAHNKN